MRQVNEILKYLKEQGIEMTRGGLYVSGKKYGYIKNVEGSKYVELDVEKFEKWVTLVKAKPPKNMVNLKQASLMLGLSRAMLYKLTKDLNYTKFGRGQVKYYKIDDIRRAFNKRKADKELSWRIQKR